MEFKDIACIAHEANRALCRVLGDNSQPTWDDAPDWQRSSAIAGIEGIANGSIQQPRDAHDSWSDHKRKEGWTWGEVKDPVLKTHPCLVPYDQLPAEQQIKDHLFFAIVRALI